MAAPSALAQEVTGNIYGKVVDEQGAPFPGVEVTLTGIGAPLAATTTGSGEFRFLTLSPGEYKVSAAVAGFSVADTRTLVSTKTLSLMQLVAVQPTSSEVEAPPEPLDGAPAGRLVGVLGLD